MEEKFLETFNLTKDDIYRLIYSYTKNKIDIDDIFQNTYIKLYKHPKILEKDSLEIKKWLIKVAINECKTIWLSSWKKKIVPITELEENTYGTTINTDETLNEVFKLPSKYRIVIYLYYYEGYKIKEIAKILNMSETNIQTILQRGRIQLKDILKED